MAMYWPIALVVFSNVIYHICSKSIPQGADPWLSLIVNYAIALVLTVGVYIFTRGTASFSEDFSKINWAPIAMGITIVGLEVGNLLMYRAGWDISVGSLVQNILLAIALVIVGILLYREGVSAIKLGGIAVCCLGLWMVTR